ncbi:MAG: aspartate-semialdehyde dehydrogenase [Bacteriovoracaceae bacterium]|jgi:aspartate-semialdehyde dehydrogenase|nr:aspartate-semialdehyde dehydrogenase [Bacteriovoracaceae bacterium]
MKNVGFIGYRGMVGSVLMERLRLENDFLDFKSHFFSTSKQGQEAPELCQNQEKLLLNAFDLSSLSDMDILVSCQGGAYTNKVYSDLKARGFNGYFIDAASSLRMNEEAHICLDPLNGDLLQQAIDKGSKTFVGGNCTVSLMLMALHGLFKEGLIDWVTSMTYQAASGAGARNMQELLMQMRQVGERAHTLMADNSNGILDVDKSVTDLMLSEEFIKDQFKVPLACSLIPWIDEKMKNGQSREEWKAMAEANKILGNIGPKRQIPIDGTCVRIGALRCHSQAFTIKLNKSVDIKTIIELIGNANAWVRTIPNVKGLTTTDLTPTKVSGTLSIPVGRIRKMNIGNNFVNGFSVGDQLLWGAAEPLRMMLNLVLRHM